MGHVLVPYAASEKHEWLFSSPWSAVDSLLPSYSVDNEWLSSDLNVENEYMENTSIATFFLSCSKEGNKNQICITILRRDGRYEAVMFNVFH